MFSNTNFKQIYPQLWDEYYGNEDNHAEPTIKVGLYAILLGISWDNGILHYVIVVVLSTATCLWILRNMAL